MFSVGCMSSRRNDAVLTPERSAYFAGLIDGEGHVTLSKNQDRKSAIWNVPTIVVAMTDRETIEACQAYFSCGSVHVKKKASPHHKTLYAWTVRWNDARFVAGAIRPYAITKAAALDRILRHPIQRMGPERRFSDEQVREIRVNYVGISYSELGKRFGVATMTAWQIVNRKTYVDVI